jgi:hypothetical protein
MVCVGRQEAKIRLPLQSLRDICLWKILFLMQSKEEIYNLEIPKTLKADLLHVCHLSTRYTDDVGTHQL